MKVMSDLMIRELSFSGHQEAGAAVVLPSCKHAQVEPEDGNVDGDVVVPVLHKHAGLWDKSDASYITLLPTNRLPQYCQALWAVVLERLPTRRGTDRFRNWVLMEFGALTRWPRDLWWSVRRLMVRWQVALLERRVWHQFAMTQQVFLTILGGMWARWRHSTQLCWVALWSCVLEKLAVASNLIGSRGVGRVQYLLHLVTVARAFHVCFCTWLAQSIINASCCVWSCLQTFWSAFRTKAWRVRQRVLHVLGSRERIIQSIKDGPLNRCLALFRSNPGFQMCEDIMFLCTEPRVRALVVALLFALAVLGEVVAASYLPAWCASAGTSDMGMKEMVVLTTFSRSVVSSMKGAAAVL